MERSKAELSLRSSADVRPLSHLQLDHHRRTSAHNAKGPRHVHKTCHPRQPTSMFFNKTIPEPQLSTTLVCPAFRGRMQQQMAGLGCSDPGDINLHLIHPIGSTAGLKGFLPHPQGCSPSCSNSDLKKLSPLAPANVEQ